MLCLQWPPATVTPLTSPTPLRIPRQVVQFTADTSAADLLNANPWLADTKLVVKPDMLFGQRGKHDLVGRAGANCAAAHSMHGGRSTAPRTKRPTLQG